MFDSNELWYHLSAPALTVALFLMTMGIASWTVFINRVLVLRRSRAVSDRFADALGPTLSPRDVDRAIAVADQHRAGSIARLFAAGLTNYRGARAHGAECPLSPVESMRRQMERQIDELLADLKRGLPLLASVGSVAPFVGLLGTVLGIISAFQGIAATGSGGLSSVSAGIAEALIETALGLAVAIPAVLAFNYLSASIARDDLALTNAAGQLVDTVEAWTDTAQP
jgi:biopolymer transport protein ExbB